MAGLTNKIKVRVKQEVVKQIANLTTNLSDKNLIRVFGLGAKIAPKELRKMLLSLKQGFEEKGPSYQMLQGYKDLHPNIRKKFIRNFMLNAGVLGAQKREAFAKKEGFYPPFLLVISPTMRCQLDCTGCYAGDYTKEDDMSEELLDDLLTQAKEMGIYFVTISGGEPFLRKELLFKMAEKHDDMFFQIYTNGQLITKEVAEKIVELGNLAPAISVEGFEKATDARRGDGVYKHVLEAMKNLKEVKALFGFSATFTKLGAEVMSSEEFLDFYVEQGCNFGWYFLYIPIGKFPNVELMATPEQRDKLRKFVHKIRFKKPIFIGDFWNDGPFVSGCMSGGRNYCHIISTGDVEPCVFCHFAVDNIKEKPLKEILQSPFFKAIRGEYPHDKKTKNLLTPCMVVDNPEILRKVVKEHNAKPSHPGSDSIINDPKIKAHLDDYSKEYHKLADPVWEKEYMNDPKNKWYKEGEVYKELGTKKDANEYNPKKPRD